MLFVQSEQSALLFVITTLSFNVNLSGVLLDEGEENGVEGSLAFYEILHFAKSPLRFCYAQNDMLT